MQEIKEFPSWMAWEADSWLFLVGLFLGSLVAWRISTYDELGASLLMATMLILGGREWVIFNSDQED